MSGVGGRLAMFNETASLLLQLPVLVLTVSATAPPARGVRGQERGKRGRRGWPRRFERTGKLSGEGRNG